MTIDLELTLNRFGFGRVAPNKIQFGFLRVGWWRLSGKHSIGIEVNWKREETLSPDPYDDDPEPLQPMDPAVMAALYPDFPPDAICVSCGRRFDDESQCHEIWKDDPCYFDPNTDANRLARIRWETQHLLGLGMTPEEIETAVRQTTVFLGKEPPP